MTNNNESRVTRAGNAMEYYVSEQLSEKYHPDSKDENLIDLLADLMHFADSKDIEFESSLRMAKINFEAEQGGKHHGI